MPTSTVFAGLDEPQEVESIIINSLLSHIRCLLLSRDEHHILDIVSAQYELPVVLAARKILFVWHEPELQYGYRGPHTAKLEKQKVIEASRGIIEKMKSLDSKGEMPMILCPSDELHKVVPISTRGPMEERLNTIEQSMTNLKSTIEDMKLYRPAMDTNSYHNHPMPALPLHMREQMNSSRGTKRVRIEDAPDLSEPPVWPSWNGDVDSDNESSVASGSSTCFEFPRSHRRHLARRNHIQNNIGGNNQQVVSSGVRRRESIWGKGTEGPADGSSLSGPPPEIFVHNCRITVERENVADHFNASGVQVLEVKKVSHQEAARHSFVMTVATKADFDKVIEGSIVPTGIAVRRYFPPRRNTTSIQGQGGAFKPVGILKSVSDASSTLNTPTSRSYSNLDSQSNADDELNLISTIDARIKAATVQLNQSSSRDPRIQDRNRHGSGNPFGTS
jgi:hypothetical protein